MLTRRDPTAIRDEAARVWRLPALRDAVSIVTSSRMRTSLGLFDARRRQVRLADLVAQAPVTLYREVVLHELAHAAVHLVHGRRGVRPHGREWRGFMEAVGLRPRVRLPRSEVQDLIPASVRRPRARWRHRCPVCQVSRLAGRPVREWRCAQCVAAGLPGRLSITRVAPPRERKAG